MITTKVAVSIPLLMSVALIVITFVPGRSGTFDDQLYAVESNKLNDALPVLFPEVRLVLVHTKELRTEGEATIPASSNEDAEIASGDLVGIETVT